MDSNWGLIGHEWAVQLLKGHLERGAPRHAYLFTGADSIGRRTLALRFAQAFNAEPPSSPGEFDPQNRTSRQIEQMQHPDLSLVERLEGDRDIKIDAVRQLQHSLSLAPYSARYRIALLLDFELANDNAANALLKTLEEPPSRVVLMLTAESADAMLPTIASRCEVIHLRPVSLEQLSQGLQQLYGVPAEQAHLLAHVSSGRPGYALLLHQQPALLARRTAWLDEQQYLLKSNRSTRFEYAQQATKEKEDYIQMLQVWLSFWRDVLLQAAQAETPLVNIDRQAEIEDLSCRLDTTTIHHLVSEVGTTISNLRTNANLRLTAEALLLEFPYI
jgi:DNA polymerase-3 subunit delta'